MKKKKGSKIRVVIDTNIILSALIVPQSTPGKILQAFKKDSFTLLVLQGHKALEKLQIVSAKEFLDTL